MNAEIINPFIQGSDNVLNMLCGEKPKLGKIFVKRKPYCSENVSIEISIVGEINGSVVFTMKMPVALIIASKMMMGMPVPELDDMSKSALSELANMISGGVATIFSGMGKSVNISTPSFKVGALSNDFSLSDAEQIICVPLTLSGDNIFELDMFLN